MGMSTGNDGNRRGPNAFDLACVEIFGMTPEEIETMIKFQPAKPEMSEVRPGDLDPLRWTASDGDLDDSSILAMSVPYTQGPRQAVAEIPQVVGRLLGRKPIVCFSGTFETMTRSEAKKRAEDAGFIVSGSVGPKTDVLVTGPGAGAKYVKAQQMGIPIFDEAAWLADLINTKVVASRSFFNSISLQTEIDDSFAEYQAAESEAGTKETNPKDSVGVSKWRQFCSVPMTVMVEVGIGMLEGARKYGRHNYRDAGVKSSIYVDAAMGHIMQWWEGEDIDKDSGLSHVTKAICSLTVLRDAMIQDMLNDDRPPKAKLGGWREEMQGVVESIFKRHPKPVQSFTEKSTFK